MRPYLIALVWCLTATAATAEQILSDDAIACEWRNELVPITHERRQVLKDANGFIEKGLRTGRCIRLAKGEPVTITKGNRGTIVMYAAVEVRLRGNDKLYWVNVLDLWSIAEVKAKYGIEPGQ
jgi:hypothetical protein